MELKEFISTTLQEITDGIKEGHTYMQGVATGKISGQYLDVNFDVNVSSEDNINSGGSGKITVAGLFNAGADKEYKTTNSNYNRIQFKVQVLIETGYNARIAV